MDGGVFVFQAMFCGTAITIVSGSVAERMRFAGYLVVALLLAGLIYPLFGHWAWNGAILGVKMGWLGSRGFVDFAGATVVHSVAGWVALAAVLCIGPREGRFPPGAPPQKITGHNLPVAMLGTVLLWFGWFGFNGGSALTVNDQVPILLANTLLAGASGLVVALAVGWPLRGRPDVDLVINGSLAGLVAITASCNAISSASAICIGGVGGLVMLALDWLLARWHIDDAVGAIPVHAGGGVWGTIAVAIFGKAELLGTNLNTAFQLGVQLLGIAFCCAWAFGLSYLILSMVNRIFPLRVTLDQERIGLNVAEHGASTELHDLFTAMDHQARTGDLNLQVPVEPFTEVGQIADRYNRVMAALREAVARTDAIASTAGDAIITFAKPSLEILTVNPSTELIFGYPGGQLVGRPFHMLLDISERLSDGPMPEDDDGRLARLIHDGGRHEVLGRRADGSTFWLEAVVTEVELDEASFYTGSLRDVSERKAQTEALKLARQQAELASEAKSSFLSTMSHELRTPMNAIIGFTEIVMERCEEVLPPRQYDNLGKVLVSAEHLLSLINHILDLSKIEAGHMEVHPTWVKLGPVLETCLRTVEPLVKHDRVQLILATDVSQYALYTDEEKLKQILMNLLSNAAKFTEQGAIRITTAARGDTLSIAIADTGIGIPDDAVARVFDEFYQIDHRRTRQYGGTGLGLSIARHLAHLLGGDLSVQSIVGAGSTFTVRLPHGSGPCR